MEYRPLDITVMSAEGLKNVNMFMKMGVYVVVSLNDNSISKKKTHVSNGGSNPKWNHRIKITLEESSVDQKSLLFQIRCNRVLGDKDIGEVLIPVSELLDGVGTMDKAGEKVVTYTVRTLNGKSKGNLKFSYKFGETFILGGENVTAKKKNDSESVRNKNDESIKVYATSNMAYQPHHQGMIYTLPQAGAPYSQAGYPAPQGYPAYPTQQQYGGGYNSGVYPPPPSGGCSGEFQHVPPGGYSGEFQRHPPLGGYTYPPVHQHVPMGYGYSSGEYPPQVQQPTHEKRQCGSATKLGLGLGAGLIGGLLVGNVITDIGEMAAAGVGDAIAVTVD